jgi:hypothetical protein
VRVNRVIADLQVPDLAAARGFCTGYLGLRTEVPAISALPTAPWSTWCATTAEPRGRT